MKYFNKGGVKLSDIVTSTSCYLSDRCWKFNNSDKSCKDNDIFCPRLFRMNYLYDQSLMSLKQRQHTPLRLDENGTDRDEFNRLKSIEDNVEKFVETGTNLYIHSPISGNGKTEWSLRILQSYISKIWFKSDLRCRVLFINVPRYLISLKESISTPSEYVDHIKKHIFDADIVVFDELGIKAATNFEYEHLLNFINTRIDLGKSNIYTSNLTSAELNDRLGSRLYSRILNMSVDVELRGADKRGL